MRTTIKLAVIGYGNVGRGVMKAIDKNDDMELACILSRSPDRVKKELGANAPVFAADDFEALKKADVAILCGGSKDDLPVQGPYYAKHINTIDSYDNQPGTPLHQYGRNSAQRRNGSLCLHRLGPGNLLA